MGNWEEDWMQFIDGLDQKDANRRILRSYGYFGKSVNSSRPPPSPPLYPPEVYSFENALSVSNLAKKQSQVLFLCPSFSCNLLTTLYLYSTQFCLIGLFLLLLGLIALFALCLLLCHHSYQECFDLKTTKVRGGRKKTDGGSHSSSPGCAYCKGQRDIIIQVNQTVPTQQPQQPLAPPPSSSAPTPAKFPLKASPPPPPESPISQPDNEVNQNAVADDSQQQVEPKSVLVESDLYFQQPEKDIQPKPAESVETSEVEPKNKSALRRDSIEVLAKHLASHLNSVQSFLESNRKRRRCSSKQSSIKSSINLGTESSISDSIYLSDLPRRLSSLEGTSSSNSSNTDGSSKKPKKRQKKKRRRSILCFPLSANQSTLPEQLTAPKLLSSSSSEYQTADDEAEAAAQLAALLLHPPKLSAQSKAEPTIPLPSNQLPQYMVLNRYAHQLEPLQVEQPDASSTSESP